MRKMVQQEKRRQSIRRQLGKRVWGLVLCVALVVGMIPVFPMEKVEAAGVISEAEMTARVKDLAVRCGLNEDLTYSNGIYFTKSGTSCCGSNDSCSSNNCPAGAVLSSDSAFVKHFDFTSVSSSQLSQHFDDDDDDDDYMTAGASCCGFANFALWYVGKTDNSSNLSATSNITRIVQDAPFTKENVQSYNLKIGDVIRCGGHSMMFLGYESNGIKVLDCNWQFVMGQDKVRIRIHSCAYTNEYYAGKKMGITRLANYDPYASAPTISNIGFKDADSTGFTVTCTVTDDEGVGAVYFPVWTNANGQDDLASIWPTGTAEGNNVYSYRVNVADHNNEYGVYVIHVYARDINGVQGGPSIASYDNTANNPNGGTTDPPADTSLSTEEITNRVKDLAVKMGLDGNLNYSDGVYFTQNGATCCGSSSCTNCKLANIVSSTWFNTAFNFTISDVNILSKHYACEEMRTLGTGSCGFANYALWYIGKSSNTSNLSDVSNITPIVRGSTFTEANLRALDLKIGDVIYCNKSDGSAGRSAMFLAYESNGLKVMDCNWGTDGTKMRVAIHNQWTYDNPDFANGTMAVTRLAKHIPTADTALPTLTNVVVTDVNSSGYTVTATATDDVGVTKVIFPTRRSDQTDDDWIWYEGTKNADGSYSKRIEVSEFGGVTGEYWTDVYACDAAGNLSPVWNVRQYIDTTPPVITDAKITNITGSGYTVECTVTDNVGVDRVQFPTWTEYNGQDDLLENWDVEPEASGAANGDVYTFRVKDLDHNFERGMYATHIYAYDAAGNQSCYTDLTCDLQNNGTIVAEETYNGHTYKLIDDKLTWQEAKAACEAVGGHLVTITSAEEQQAVEGLFEQAVVCYGYFIGGYTENGTSKWVTGESFDYSNWYDGQPDGGNGIVVEDVYYILPQRGTSENVGKWIDINSDAEGMGYICEFDPIPVEITSITLSESETEVGFGQTKTLEATVTPEGYHPPITWTSANPSIATVSDGVIIGLAAGTTTITAECGGKTATCKVTVVKPFESITLNLADKTLFKNETCTLEVSFIPADANASKELVWTSANPQVATVDEDGVVTAVGTGSTTITAALKQNPQVSATCTVQVTSYVVTFDTKGGSSIAPQEYGKDDVLEVETPTKSGYAFTGWYKDAECTIPWDIENDVVNGNITLYAGWMEYHEGLWIVDIPAQKYTGSAIKPKVEVYHYATKLTEGTDYKVSYKNNKNAGDKSSAKAPTVTVSGKGNYTGKETATFTISPKNLADAEVEADNVSLATNGKVQKPIPVVSWKGKKLKKDKDFTVEYPDTGAGAYQNDGVYTVRIVGKGNFCGERTVQFYLTGGNVMSKAKVSSIPAQAYTGKEITPEVTVKYGPAVLTKDVDYTVSYRNNVVAGTATMILKGMGSYSGEKKVTFKIKGTPISQTEVTLMPESVAYTGKAIAVPYELKLKDNSSVILKEGHDYTATYKNNTNVGTATITFKGINGYSGSVKKTFRITGYDIKADSAKAVTVKYSPSIGYMKGGTTMEPKVTCFGKNLKKNVDYKLTYKNNKKVYIGSDTAKKPTLIISGKGNYSGSLELNFNITTQDISLLNMTAPDKVYQSKAGKYASKPVIKDVNGKKLTAGKDYEKEYVYTYTADTTLADGTIRTAGSVIQASDILPAGTSVTVTAKGMGNYTGEISCTYRIVQADISKANGKIAAQIYTGQAIEPGKSDITLKVGKTTLAPTDYEIVSYSNNVRKGTATVVVKGVGNYGGTREIKFKIKSKVFSWWWR